MMGMLPKMRRRSSLLFVLILTMTLSIRAMPKETDPRAAPRSLRTEFTYKTVVSALPAGAKTLAMWIPLPSDSEWQQVEKITVEGVPAYRITQEPRYGNRMVYLHLERPQAPLIVTVCFTVQRREVRIRTEEENAPRKAASLERGQEMLRRCLEPDKNVPMGGKFETIAREITRDKVTPAEKARALFEHVITTMQYDYKKESPKLGEGDVAFVCDYKKGNCSDLHSYLISLARSLGIPAVLEYGFPVTGIPLASPLAKEGSLSGYHCWVWFKDPARGWVPMDASDGRRWQDAKRPDIKDYLFGNLVLERSAVTFSRGRDLTLSPAQKAGPLNYFIYPYGEADGKPIQVAWELRYRLP
jgi:transglutaminase-like putative cysteine protease